MLLSRLATCLTILVLALTLGQIPTRVAAQVSIGLSVNSGPPAIPVYEQPPCPTANYLWSPGYWAYGDGGYYWVPGTWVPAPSPGLDWTPGYWGWNNGSYQWNQGYWAPQVGYYGGVNYGYGYYGRGYAGGGWQGNRYRYNTAITNVNRGAIRNVYVNRSVAVSGWNRVSYNGGRGGIAARPSQSQLAVARGQHVPATSVQMQHQRVASSNRQYFAAVNHGRPPIAASIHPLANANRSGRAEPFAMHAASHPRAPAALTQPVPRHALAHAQAAEPAAPRRAAPHHAAAQHVVAPQDIAAPHMAAPHMAAPRTHLAAPPHVAASQHLAAPPHVAAPQHIAAPPHVAAPQHIAAPPHVAAPHAAPEHPGPPHGASMYQTP